MSTASERKVWTGLEYVTTHRIRWLLEKISSELIHFRPRNPLQYMIERVPDIRDRNIVTVEKPKIVAMLGAPGSGKGAQCAKLVQELGVIWLSPADLMRTAVKEGSTLGKQVSSHLQRGEPVPTPLIVALLKEHITEHAADATYVLDDFPRTLEQALAFEKEVGEVNVGMYLDAPDDVLLARLHERGAHTGRTGDQPEEVLGRFQHFYLHTYPVVEYLRAQEKLHVVDASKNIRDVFTRVHQLMS